MRCRYGRGALRRPGGRDDGPEVRRVPAAHRVDRLEHRQLSGGQNARLIERVLSAGYRQRDGVPIQDHISPGRRWSAQQCDSDDDGRAHSACLLEQLTASHSAISLIHLLDGEQVTQDSDRLTRESQGIPRDSAGFSPTQSKCT